MSVTHPDALFPAHLHELTRRADRVLAGSGCDSLVLAAGVPPMQFQDDQPYPFKAGAHFRAWAPLLDAPGSYVVYRPGHRPTLLFYQPEDYWHQPPALPTEAWLDQFEVVRLKQPAEAQAHLPAACACIGPLDAWPTESRAAQHNPPALVAALDYARAVKTPYEVECLRVASRLGAQGHNAALAAWTAGASEYEIHLAYLKATGHEEAELPYPSIIAANEAAAVLHYTVRRRLPVAPRRTLLIDAGAQFRGYASDITRTHAAASGAFADLVTALEELQQRLCTLVVPGRPYAEIHLATHAGIAEILCRAGLIHGSVEAAVESGLTSVFFPHGIGHLLGLQVHDVGGFMASERGGVIERPAGHPYLRLTRTLEDGFVVTIEPGLYFIPMLLAAARANAHGRQIRWDAVEALQPWGGIRIEDNVVARAAGAQNLTRAAFAAA